MDAAEKTAEAWVRHMERMDALPGGHTWTPEHRRFVIASLARCTRAYARAVAEAVLDANGRRWDGGLTPEDVESIIAAVPAPEEEP